MQVSSVGMSPQLYTHVKAHAHSAWEIVLNTQGHGVTEIGAASYPFAPGTIICQPPDVPHNKTSRDGFRDVFIQLSSFPLAGAADENGVIVLRDDVEGSFEALLSMAHRVFHRKEANARRIVDALYEAMHQLLLSWLHREPEDKEIVQLQNRMIRSFMDPECTVASLLGEGAYCRDHLRRRFKQATGMTPSGYLTALRIENAKKLLRQNGVLHYTVAEIGAMSGYYDSRYFARVFHRETGRSPTEYLGGE